MTLKKQYIVTAFSIVVLSFLAYAFWISDKNYEYSSLGMSIHIMLGYLVAVVLGIVSLFKVPFKNKKTGSLSIYNFIGTLNVYVAAIGLLFIYSDNNNHLSGQMSIFIYH